MRRADKQIQDRQQIDAVIRQCRVCRLAMVDDGAPYVVPVSFGYDGTSLFVHSAPEGRKIRALRAHPRVCVEFDLDVEPVRGEQACNWGMRFRSVVAFGTAVFLEAAEPKRQALQAIMVQYAGPGESFEFRDDDVARTALIRIDLEAVTGKQSGY